MGNFIKFILLFYFIKICFSIVPLWDFDSSAIPLIVNDTTNYTYVVFSNDFMEFKYNITKTLYLNNGSLEQENKLYLEDEYFGITSYDDIESAYFIDGHNYYVCPKGRHNVHRYYKENKEIKSEILNYQTKGDWDLHCFMQHNQTNKTDYHYLFIFYLGTENFIYNFNLDNNSFIQTLDIYNGIYAYKWRITYLENNRNLGIQMFAIVKEDENITLKDLRFNVTRGENPSYWEEKKRYLGKVKSHFLAFFNEYHFYWINYNQSDISDFESGYYNDKDITKDNININNININKDSKSPFEFYDNFTIDTIKFIYGNKYVYYKIHKNNDNNISYHGIIDVILNRIVFNTDKDIKEFKPYSNNSFLAITNDKAYKICIIRGEGYNCTESCSDNQYIYDSTGYNKCGGEGCESNVILKPNDICINSCNTSIYNLINETECWLCKDLDDKKKKYKLLNSSICLEKLLNHSHIVNENLNLIDCDEYFKFDENSTSCIPSQCHSNCLTCEEYSENDYEQNCIECRKGLFLHEKNCNSSCLNKFFKNIQNKRCEKCDDSCETCSNAATCDTCVKGKFLNEILKCENCSHNCESCSISENNCSTCYKNSEFKYFYNHSCYEKCPNGTISDYDTLICIEVNDEKNEPKGNGGKSGNKNKYLLIFLIIAGILLLLILFCCIRRCCCKKKVSDEKIMEEINTELIENKNLVDE